MPSVSMCTHCLTSGGPEDDLDTKALKVTSKPSKQRMLALSGPLEFMFYSMLGTYQETEAHTGKSYFPNVTGQKWFFPPSIIIILLYRSAIYYTVPTTWQGPIYNAGIEGVRLACSLWSQ